MKDKAYWNAFYEKELSEMEKAPSKFLLEYKDFLRKGKTIEIACGIGSNALYLAKSGFQVEAIDFSNIAIEKAKLRAAAEGLNVDFKVQGLDFFLMPVQKYDSVVVTDYKCSARLLDEIKKGLVVGGTLLIEAYTYNHIKNNIGVDMDVEECYKNFELSRILKDWNLLFYDERSEKNIYKVKALAIKPSY